MKNVFQSVRIRKPKLSLFDLSFENKMSTNEGLLVPFVCKEVVPGDIFQMSSQAIIRAAPMLAPIMHRINVFQHYFFVPNRLVYEDWEDFITGGEDGLDASSFPRLHINGTSYTGMAQNRTLGDYYGIPHQAAAPTTDPLYVSALPFRGYQVIFDEFYRDQNLTTKVDVTKVGGTENVWANIAPQVQMRVRAWERDYFTSALPWLQKGTAVGIPVDWTYKSVSEVYLAGGSTPAASTSIDTNAATPRGTAVSGSDVRIENLDDPITVSVNDLRNTVRLQEWLEKNARAGSRYIESILAHFGVISDDARLQRPEYLGGNMAPLTISEVLSNTKSTAETQPLAEMGGHGMSAANNSGFKRRFKEHGYIHGIMSIMPRTAYYQGVPKHLLYNDKFDFYWPEFANIGEQAVDRYEIWYKGNAAKTAGDFGYQQRYAQYKHSFDEVHGDFRDTLDFWHLGRKFTSEPLLNDAFIRNSTPDYRQFAVLGAATHHYYAQVWNQIRALRPMPYHAIPTL